MKGVYVRTDKHKEWARGLFEKYQKGKPSKSKGKKGEWTQSLESRKKRSEALKGRKLSEETKKKIGLGNKGKTVSLETRLKMKQAFIGEKNPNWQGGKTDKTKKIRNSAEYKLWRQAVFSRDRYTCIWCTSKELIEADHIKPFAHYPELRFAIDNGRTLCRKCHKTTDTYGTKKISKS